MSAETALRDAAPAPSGPATAVPDGSAAAGPPPQAPPDEGAPAFDLTAYLPYLINRAGAALAAAFSREIERHGATLPMWRVLGALYHRDGLRIGDLARLTSIDISTLSRLVGKMEARGFVARQRGAAADRRAVAVALMPAGRAAAAAILPVARRYEAAALDGFSDGEAAALRQMLVRVYGNLEGIGAG